MLQWKNKLRMNVGIKKITYYLFNYYRDTLRKNAIFRRLLRFVCFFNDDLQVSKHHLILCCIIPIDYIDERYWPTIIIQGDQLHVIRQFPCWIMMLFMIESRFYVYFRQKKLSKNRHKGF